MCDADIDHTDQKIYTSLVEMCEAGIREEVRSWFADFDAKKIQRAIHKFDSGNMQPTENDLE